MQNPTGSTLTRACALCMHLNSPQKESLYEAIVCNKSVLFFLSNQFSKVHQQERTKLQDKQKETLEKLAQVQQKVW